MKTPPEYFQPILMDIELTVVEIHKEFPRLSGADVEWVYEKLNEYFKVLARGKETDEPESPSEMKQALIDEILNLLDARQEKNYDDFLINNPAYLHGEHLIHSLPYLNAILFKLLKNSARFWRKKEGNRGYLNHIANVLPNG